MFFLNINDFLFVVIEMLVLKSNINDKTKGKTDEKMKFSLFCLN